MFTIILIILSITLVSVYLLYRYLNKNIYTTVDHFNKILDSNCDDPSVLDPNTFSWSQDFRDNWKEIREEFLNYRDNIPLHVQVNNLTGWCDIDNKWKTLFLRAFCRDTDLSDNFPKTMDLINKCPCTLAYFSILEPGAKLAPHIGIYKGVIRYHLGLIIPKDRENCFLKVDNKTLHWQEGSDLMFDDMYLHHAENNTAESRIILFLDIKREFSNPIINILNTLMLRFIRSNDAVTDTISNINKFSSNTHSQNDLHRKSYQ